MRATFVESKFFRAWEVTTDLLIVNVLWLLCCLPVVTVYPATAAMFGVFRAWTREQEPGVFRTYLNAFTGNLRRSLLVGAVWVPTGLFLTLDIYIVARMPQTQQWILLPLLFAAAIVYLAATIYIFPVLVSFDLDWRGVLKNSLLLAVGRPGTTAGCLATVTAATALLVWQPAVILLVGGPAAYLIFRLCYREFTKIARTREYFSA